MPSWTRTSAARSSAGSPHASVARATIADIAAAARTSRSTVYAHFANKEAVFLALYSTASDNVLAVIDEADGEARAAGLGWR